MNPGIWRTVCFFFLLWFGRYDLFPKGTNTNSFPLLCQSYYFKRASAHKRVKKRIDWCICKVLYLPKKSERPTLSNPSQAAHYFKRHLDVLLFCSSTAEIHHFHQASLWQVFIWFSNRHSVLAGVPSILICLCAEWKPSSQTAKQGQSDATMTYNDGTASEGGRRDSSKGLDVSEWSWIYFKTPALTRSPICCTCLMFYCPVLLGFLYVFLSFVYGVMWRLLKTKFFLVNVSFNVKKNYFIFKNVYRA